MKQYILLFSLCAVIFFNCRIQAQTAIDFTLTDCNGIEQNLYSILDQGKVAIVVYEMQCTGSLNGCTKITTVMNNFYSTNNKIKLMYLDNAEYNCSETANWISTNSLFPGNMMEYSNDYSSPYGMGMPVIVIAAGTDHHAYLIALNSSDTATIHNAISHALADLITTPKAFDFTYNDCNGTSQNLYTTLNKNKVSVMVYEHQCGMCTAGTTKLSTVMNNYYSNDTNIIVMYLDNGGHDCASTASWINSHSFFQGLNFEYASNNDSPYGLGMPVVAIAGGNSHKICLIGRNSLDTNALHNAIECALDELTASIEKKPFTNDSFGIYPNPVSSNTLILISDFNNLAPVSADIIDLSGHILKKDITINSNNAENQNEISVSNLMNGLYFIRINTDRGSVLKKFVINK